MRSRVVFSAVVVAWAAVVSRAVSSAWQARRMVELQVTSRTARPERVRGVIISDDGIGVRTIDAMTPFTLTVPARTVNATIHADRSASLMGEMKVRVFGFATGASTRGWSENGFVLYADKDHTGFRGL